MKPLILALVVLAGVFLAFRVAAADKAPRAPESGDPAPDFILPDAAGTPVALQSFRGRWVVLYFYPKDDTPGCTEEACQFRDDWAQLQALGVQVLGVSVDDSASHAAFAKKHGLPFPLLADVGGTVAKAYGAYADWVVFKFAKRYTFLISPDGRIARTYLKVDTSKHSSEVIADLKQLTGRN